MFEPEVRVVHEERIAAVDVGTTKICVLIARADSNGALVGIGLGSAPSQGVKKGIVVDIAQVSDQIQSAFRGAQFDAGCRCRRAWVSIAGDHIGGQDNRGFHRMGEEQAVIRRRDVERVLDYASRIALPEGREILHRASESFVVDGHEDVANPAGMRGMQLEARAYLVTVSAACRENLESSVRKAGVETTGMVLQPLASGLATMTAEEQRLGVALADIGGGTTDVAVFLKEGLRFVRVLAVGGNHITQDVAVAFHTTWEEAERLKLEAGNAVSAGIDEAETVEAARVAGREGTVISRRALAEVIECRVEEIIDLIQGVLVESGCIPRITSGLILTGGTAQLPGIKEKTEARLPLPVRIGCPDVMGDTRLQSPSLATVQGLIRYAGQQQDRQDRRGVGRTILKWIKDFV